LDKIRAIVKGGGIESDRVRGGKGRETVKEKEKVTGERDGETCIAGGREEKK